MSDDTERTDPQPPFYNHLGRPAGDLTDDQRAILAASEREIAIEMALGSGIPGEIGEVLAWLGTRGWRCELKSPFAPGDLYWAGLTPHSTSGWNGRPDHQVGDVTLRGALWRVILLMLVAERKPAAHEVREAGGDMLPGMDEVAAKPADERRQPWTA